jgi:hypothetical protein
MEAKLLNRWISIDCPNSGIGDEFCDIGSE